MEPNLRTRSLRLLHWLQGSRVLVVVPSVLALATFMVALTGLRSPFGAWRKTIIKA